MWGRSGRMVVVFQGRLQVSVKGGGGESSRGLWNNVPRGGFRISGFRRWIEKCSPSGASFEKFRGILCEKSRFFAKNPIFYNFSGVPPPLESTTDSGSDNTST